MEKDVTNIHGEIVENEILRLMGKKYCKRKRIIYLVFAYISIFFLLMYFFALLGGEDGSKDILILFLGAAFTVIFFFFMAYVIYGNRRYLKYGIAVFKKENNILPSISNDILLKPDKVIILNKKPKNVFYISKSGDFQLYLANKYSKIYTSEELLDFEIKGNSQTIIGNQNKKVMDKKRTAYSLLVRINDLNNPTLFIEIEHYELVEQIYSILLMLLKENNQKNFKTNIKKGPEKENVVKNDKFIEKKVNQEFEKEKVIKHDFGSKKKLRFWIIFGSLIVIVLFVIIISNGSPTSSTEEPEKEDIKSSDCIIEANDVQFNFRKYIKYESEVYDYDFYVFDVHLINNKTSDVEIETSYFSIKSSDVSIVIDNELFFHGLICEKEKQIEILFKAKKGMDISDVVIEVDFGFFSLGATLTLGNVSSNKSNEMFENVLIQKFGCVKSEHYGLINTLIKNESLGLLSNCAYTFIEDLMEDTYVLSTVEGDFSLSIDFNGNYNMMHFYQGTVYDVYIDSVRNPYYLKTSRIIKEFASEQWQRTIENFVDIYYTEASCSGFKWGRMESLENAMGISFTVKGKNAYGMTLTKYGEIYLIYDFKKDEFECSYFKIGDEIVEDHRLTISFDTGTTEPLSSLKVMKGATISMPALKYDRQGYELIGWRKYGEDKLFDFNTRIESSIKLIAVWEKHPIVECELIVDEDVTNIDEKIINIEYGSSYCIPVPEKESYKFIYWYCVIEGEEMALTTSAGNSLRTFFLKEKIYIYPKFEYIGSEQADS